MKVSNKVVWITGASSGIGEQLVRQVVAKNGKVVLSARREDRLSEIVSDLNLSADRCLILPLDLNNLDEPINYINQILAKFGTLDILINNGGVSQKSGALETTEEVDRQLMEVNFYGGVKLAKAATAQMLAQGSGHIVAISSILGQFGLPLLGTYAAAKHAIYGWYESLRYEVQKQGVSVTIISPGFINTDVTYKSLTADGSALNQNSVAQEKGMSSVKCAKKIITAIENKRWHKYIGGVETFMPMVKWMAHKPFFWLMNKLSKQ